MRPKDILALIDEGARFQMTTIFNRSGSAPRTSGTKMAVMADGSFRNTIGGGQLEAMVIRQAVETFANGQASILDFALTGKDAAEMESICGGFMSVLIESVDPALPFTRTLYASLAEAEKKHQKAWLIGIIPEGKHQMEGVKRLAILQGGELISDDPGAKLDVQGEEWGVSFSQGRDAIRFPSLEGWRNALAFTDRGRVILAEPLISFGCLVLLGGGHVAHKTAPIADMVGFEVVVIDDRPDFCNPQRFPMATHTLVNSFDDVFKGITVDENTYVVIVTRGHMNDLEALEQSLGTKAGYVGMIGSKRKRELIYKTLQERGFTKEDLGKVYSPIGVAIEAESPEEIGVSIVAELIHVRAKKSQ